MKLAGRICEDTSLTSRETNFDGRPYLDNCAEFFSTSTLFPIYDIRKDVHQPSRFGLLEFTDN